MNLGDLNRILLFHQQGYSEHRGRLWESNHDYPANVSELPCMDDTYRLYLKCVAASDGPLTATDCHGLPRTADGHASLPLSPPARKRSLKGPNILENPISAQRLVEKSILLRLGFSYSIPHWKVFTFKYKMISSSRCKHNPGMNGQKYPKNIDDGRIRIYASEES